MAHPEAAPAWFVAGSALSALGRTAEAVAALTVAQRLDPEHAETATNLANAHLDADDCAAAERWLRRAVELAPRQPEAWASLGYLLAGTGRATRRWRRATWRCGIGRGSRRRIGTAPTPACWPGLRARLGRF